MEFIVLILVAMACAVVVYGLVVLRNERRKADGEDKLDSIYPEFMPDITTRTAAALRKSIKDAK